MTCRQLVDQCDALNARTGRRFSIKGQNHAVCLMDESNSPYTPWTSSNKTLSQWMEFMRRGYEIGKAKYRHLDGNVECCMCGRQVPEETAHLHQGKWIGDNCCWDERLRASE